MKLSDFKNINTRAEYTNAILGGLTGFANIEVDMPFPDDVKELSFDRTDEGFMGKILAYIFRDRKTGRVYAMETDSKKCYKVCDGVNTSAHLAAPGCAVYQTSSRGTFFTIGNYVCHAEDDEMFAHTSESLFDAVAVTCFVIGDVYIYAITTGDGNVVVPRNTVEMGGALHNFLNEYVNGRHHLPAEEANAFMRKWVNDFVDIYQGGFVGNYEDYLYKEEE